MVSDQTIRTGRWATRLKALALTFGVLLLVPSAAHASLFSPETEDKLATFLAIVVIFVVPIVLIVLFWLVHILPEKIAHKRHHPQFEAIRTLCLLSLVFGGLLWPLAWIWAYSRPVFYKMAYGTDVGPDAHAVTDPHAPEVVSVGLGERLARLEARGVPASALDRVRADLDALEAKLADQEAR
jgi:CBS domain containing-hemolysin-like protein